MLFYRRITVFEAVQWRGIVTEELKDFLGLKTTTIPIMSGVPQKGDLLISIFLEKEKTPSLEAWLWVEKSQTYAVVSPGMWIVKEIDSSGFYPITNEILGNIADPVSGPPV